MNNPKSIFVIAKREDIFLGNAKQCAEHIGTKAVYIRKAAKGGYIKGYLIKKLYNSTIIYCIEKCGKTYRSSVPKELQRLVWLSPQTIKRYCIEHVTNNGCYYYCSIEMIDVEDGKTRKFNG